jgi:hypothetical protein
MTNAIAVAAKVSGNENTLGAASAEKASFN